MNKIVKQTTILLTTILLSGCLGATQGLHTRPESELAAFAEGRMYRGYVDFIPPEDKVAEWLDTYPYSDEEFQQAWGFTKEEARQKQYVMMAWVSAPGQRIRYTFLADRKWDLQKDDIIDYRGIDTKHNIKNRERVKGASIGFAFRIPVIQHGEAPIVYEDDKPAYVLGVVCRASEPDCDYNSSPATTIGMGRRILADGSDYRGPVGESEQEMYVPGQTVFQFWGINACQNCDDENGYTTQVVK